MSLVRQILYCQIALLVGLGYVAATKAGSDSEIYAQTSQQKSQLQAQADLEKQRIELAKQTADSYSQNQVRDVQGLILQGYTYSPNNPPQGFDWQHSVDSTQRTLIYDQFRRCVGVALSGSFISIDQQPTACETQS
jgi:hypothetical protein